MNTTRNQKRKIRQRRIRSKIVGTLKKPRFSVFKSNKDLYVQLIDDIKGNTIISFDSRKIKQQTLSEKAKEIGTEIAKLAKEKKIKEVVFDRSGYVYKGVIKILADTAREGGLKF